MKTFTINMVIEVPDHVTQEQFGDSFLKWIEDNKFIAGGINIHKEEANEEQIPFPHCTNGPECGCLDHCKIGYSVPRLRGGIIQTFNRYTGNRAFEYFSSQRFFHNPPYR